MIRNIALSLAEADIIGFSCYSSHATIVKRLFKEIKTLNSRAYIIWGGIHPIIDPEDAIQFADAICTGEGEFAFRDFFSAYSEGKDYFSTKNFWFKKMEASFVMTFGLLQREKKWISSPICFMGKMN